MRRRAQAKQTGALMRLLTFKGRSGHSNLPHGWQQVRATHRAPGTQP